MQTLEIRFPSFYEWMWPSLRNDAIDLSAPLTQRAKVERSCYSSVFKNILLLQEHQSNASNQPESPVRPQAGRGFIILLSKEDVHMNQYQSASITDLAKALLCVQRTVQPVTKDAENPFTKSWYASLNSVMDACRDALIENDNVRYFSHI